MIWLLLVPLIAALCGLIVWGWAIADTVYSTSDGPSSGPGGSSDLPVDPWPDDDTLDWDGFLTEIHDFHSYPVGGARIEE